MSEITIGSNHYPLTESFHNNDRNGQKFSTVRIFPKFSERVNYHLTLFQKGKNSWRVGNDKGSLWVGMNRCEEVSKNPKVGCLIHSPSSVWFFNSEDDANNNRNGQKFSNGLPDIFTYSGRALQLLVFKKRWNSWLVGNDKGSLWVGMNACEEYIPREPAQPDQREEEICKNPRACCNGMMHLPDGQAVPCGYGGTRF